MTWDKPTNKKCPQCGGVIYRHYTKEDKRNLCHVPGCGYEEPIATRGKKAAAADGEEAKTVKKTAAKKTTKKAETAEKKTAAKKTAEKKTAAKKTTATKKAAEKKTTTRKTTKKAEKTDA